MISSKYIVRLNYEIMLLKFKASVTFKVIKSLSSNIIDKTGILKICKVYYKFTSTCITGTSNVFHSSLSCCILRALPTRTFGAAAIKKLMGMKLTVSIKDDVQ